MASWIEKKRIDSGSVAPLHPLPLHQARVLAEREGDEAIFEILVHVEEELVRRARPVGIIRDAEPLVLAAPLDEEDEPAPLGLAQRGGVRLQLHVHWLAHREVVADELVVARILAQIAQHLGIQQGHWCTEGLTLPRGRADALR